MEWREILRHLNACRKAFPLAKIKTMILERTPCGSMAKDGLSGPFDCAPLMNVGQKVPRRFAQGDRFKRCSRQHIDSTHAAMFESEDWISVGDLKSCVSDHVLGK